METRVVDFRFSWSQLAALVTGEGTIREEGVGPFRDLVYRGPRPDGSIEEISLPSYPEVPEEIRDLVREFGLDLEDKLPAAREKQRFGMAAALILAQWVLLRDRKRGKANDTAETRDAERVSTLLHLVAGYREVLTACSPEILKSADQALMAAFEAGMMAWRLRSRPVQRAAAVGEKVITQRGRLPKVNYQLLRQRLLIRRQEAPKARRSEIIRRVMRDVGVSKSTVERYCRKDGRDILPPRAYTARK